MFKFGFRSHFWSFQNETNNMSAIETYSAGR